MVSTAKPAIRVRFPPSPTGHWHLGGARTALFNWLFVRKHGGAFILRFEDTDLERSAKEFETEIAEAMAWLGLNWDEGPDKGDYGPYRQSERLPIYRKYLEQLLADGRAYYCYCTKEELEAERQALTAEGLPPKYGGHCRNLTASPTGKLPQAIRFKTPETEIEFKDLIRGTVKFDMGLVGDMVIARHLDSPLYNFAVAVDDELMGITHVIRGEEHLSNTPKQILIQRALNFREPQYAHLPLILAPDRKKLSKRYTETSLLKYRDEGYLPEAIMNFLALLGWHPSHDQEVFSQAELVKEFDLKRAQKAGAIFDEHKLNWLNREHIKLLSNDELKERLRPFLKEEHLQMPNGQLDKLVSLGRERLDRLSEFPEQTEFFFSLPDYAPELLLWKNDLPATTQTILKKIQAALSELTDLDRQKVMEVLAGIEEEYGRGSVLWPLRVAVSGLRASPDPIQIVEVLEKEETLRRLTLALAKLASIL